MRFKYVHIKKLSNNKVGKIKVHLHNTPPNNTLFARASIKFQHLMFYLSPHDHWN
jgi:hypothetical protein